MIAGSREEKKLPGSSLEIGHSALKGRQRHSNLLGERKGKGSESEYFASST